MRFEETLRKSIYEPWGENYIDYTKLKQLLREEKATENNAENWTEDDEGRFVEELVNVQLEKVNSFQVHTYERLRERISEYEGKLDRVAHKTKDEATEEKTLESKEETLQEALKELDRITMEVNELEKYSRLNFTGFLKAAKKHDRRRGSNYRVRPLLQVRLASLPFNSEDYSPLLYR